MQLDAPPTVALLITLTFSAATPLRGRAADYRPDLGKNLGFPIYANNPPGKQLDGAFAPTDTPPLAPGETEKKFKVPKGFEVRLFASEPEVVNPVAMTWDERGRLWVVELYEYPMGTPEGQKGRDRIKILEDTDADGRADRVQVFADGFSLATGLALGNAGVYLGVAPNLLFLEDTNADDRADKTTVLATGFGLEDRHELLNSFAWGPDGWLYLTHGVFTYSTVKDPDDPDDDGVRMDAALARYHPRSRKFEVFADGTSNPWGVDWNERGDAFVSACVIMHLFHMAPGGLYNRQGGTWPNPFGYVQDLPTKGLPAIVNWRHHRAAHAGICVYQGDQWPESWRGLTLLGNIHQSALNCDRLSPIGATYSAAKESTLLGPSRGDWEVGAGNFLLCDDRWFRPVSAQTGPDGALWVMDWSDKYPCYQNARADPGGVDRELGRIWRVVWVGDQPGRIVPSRPDPRMDLAKLSSVDLVQRLTSRNSWQQRTARRLLIERGDESVRIPLQGILHAGSPDRAARRPTDQRLAALATLHGSTWLDDRLLDDCAADPQPELRVWAARYTGEAGHPTPPAFDRLAKLAADPDPTVRAACAVALRQFASGSLTVNSRPASRFDPARFRNVSAALLNHPSSPEDSYYPHIVWMAMEPLVATDPGPFLLLSALSENPTSAYALRRMMRRICDLTDPATRESQLNNAVAFLASISSKTALADAALDGLIDAFRTRAQPPTIDLEPIFARLNSNPVLTDKARRLATLLGDTSASLALIAKINDPQAPLQDRLRAIEAARETRDNSALTELLRLLPRSSPAALTPADPAQQLYNATLRALGSFDNDAIPSTMIAAWKQFNLPTRRTAAEILVTRSKWSRALLAGLDSKVVAPEDISASARRTLANSNDRTVVDHANRLLGRYRATGEDKLQLIAQKRKVVLRGEPDPRAGHEIARSTCFVCHKLHGEGADVGPDLTGAGRSTLDALLHNIIDPNEVIGNGFENIEVELTDGRVLSGRIVEDTPSRLRLLASGPTENLIARTDIATLPDGKPAIRTSELSLMPEGLEQLPDADFRNLIWFLLNPPQDGRPWTPELRRELLGSESR